MDQDGVKTTADNPGQTKVDDGTDNFVDKCYEDFTDEESNIKLMSSTAMDIDVTPNSENVHAPSPTLNKNMSVLNIDDKALEKTKSSSSQHGVKTLWGDMMENHTKGHGNTPHGHNGRNFIAKSNNSTLNPSSDQTEPKHSAPNDCTQTKNQHASAQFLNTRNGVLTPRVTSVNNNVVGIVDKNNQVQDGDFRGGVGGDGSNGGAHGHQSDHGGGKSDVSKNTVDTSNSKDKVNAAGGNTAKMDEDSTIVTVNGVNNNDPAPRALVHIRHRNHPVESLSIDQMTEALDKIEDFYEAVMGDHILIHRSVPRVNEGTLDIQLNGNIAAAWLLDVVEQIGLQLPITASIADVQEQRVRLTVRLRNREISEGLSFRRLQLLNPGMDFREWRIVGSRPIAHTQDMLLTIVMPVSSANRLSSVFDNNLRYGVEGSINFRAVSRSDTAGNRARKFGFRRT